MVVRVSTPRLERIHTDVARLRFATDDGWRGVLPGHEPSRTTLVPGPIALVTREQAGERLRWLATEGGLITIGSAEVVITTRWATHSDTLEQLSEAVRVRDRAREQVELEARELARRHELAVRRALIALQRKVARP
uniref:ATP synthase F1 epsilon subunit n=1 Tax=uncultured bacterium pSY1435 TaxID=561717 RepID=C4N420_9BACT|nr:ATP synthase F1 epsilon subunit [uncultured bacterium pSY1435]